MLISRWPVVLAVLNFEKRKGISGFLVFIQSVEANELVIIFHFKLACYSGWVVAGASSMGVGLSWLDGGDRQESVVVDLERGFDGLRTYRIWAVAAALLPHDVEKRMLGLVIYFFRRIPHKPEASYWKRSLLLLQFWTHLVDMVQIIFGVHINQHVHGLHTIHTQSLLEFVNLLGILLSFYVLVVVWVNRACLGHLPHKDVGSPLPQNLLLDYMNFLLGLLKFEFSLLLLHDEVVESTLNLLDCELFFNKL